MYFSKKKGDKRAFYEKVVQAWKPKEVLECDIVISNKREIAELFDAHFIQIADDVPLMKETEYGQHFENHPSIKAIHEKNSAIDAPLCFNFEHINQAQVEKALLDVNVRKSCGNDMLSPSYLS